MPSSAPMVVLNGIAAAPGIAIGPIHCVARGVGSPEVYEISSGDVGHEKARFQEAVAKTKKQLSALQKRVENLSHQTESEIFEAHVMMLEDGSITKKVEHMIEARLQNAEYCFYAVMQNFLEAMRRIPDNYLKERAVDIEDVMQRVLLNFSEEELQKDFHALDDQYVLVAYDLTPSDTASLDRRHVLGFVTEQGSINSHTAILSRAFGLPAVVGLETPIIDLETLTPAIVDGYQGKLILHPDADTVAKYRKIILEKENIQHRLDANRGADTHTKDGRMLTVSANIEFIKDLPLIKQSGARGVGLYRTEFLLLNGDVMPDEFEQAKVYSRLVKEMAPHSVIIRTLDAGGDKLPVEPLTEPEPNPFLGWRGIRVSLSREPMFREQLKGVLRASAFGNIAVMFPMVSCLSEIRKARAILLECMDELEAKKISFQRDIPVGVMIEVPSAAMCADFIAPEVDFFSIGTNDLIQYTVAVDRINPHVAGLYRPSHPAVIRLIKRTIDAANDHGIWTGICGEMAADIRLTPLLIGLGVEELSVGPQMVSRLGQVIRSLSYAECAVMADQCLKESRSQTILDNSLSLARKHYAELLD